MALVSSDDYCGLGPIFVENEDPGSIEFLYDIVYSSVVAKIKILHDGSDWLEEPIVTLDSNLLEINVITAVQNYQEIKGWPTEHQAVIITYETKLKGNENIEMIVGIKWPEGADEWNTPKCQEFVKKCQKAIEKTSKNKSKKILV